MARKRHGLLVVDGGPHAAVDGGSLNTRKPRSGDGSTSSPAMVGPMASVDLLRPKPVGSGTHRRAWSLPPSLPPRLLSREQAAEYCGLSRTFFDQTVANGGMPRPARLGRRVLWDRHKLDAAIDKLDSDDAGDDPYGRQSA
jgi:excisionase family DNA binding protein